MKKRILKQAKNAKAAEKTKEKKQAGKVELGQKIVERVPTGVTGFDDIVSGGFERDSIVLVGGDSGTGKTIFGLEFLYHGIDEFNEPGAFISFAESKEAVYRHAKTFGWDFAKFEKEGKFAFIRYEPHEVMKVIEEGGGTIRDTIESIGAKRLVIDSLSAYTLLFADPYKASEAVLDLFDMLKAWNCTSIVISEELVTLEKRKTDRSEFLADGIVYMYHIRKESVRTRAIEVLKLRDTKIVERLFPMQITSTGITIFPEAQVFEEF